MNTKSWKNRIVTVVIISHDGCLRLFCFFVCSTRWFEVGEVNQFENTVVTYFTMFTSTVVVALSIKTHTIPIEVLNVKILTNTT